MGEEQKKPEDKKPEEAKKPEEPKVEEAKKPEEPPLPPEKKDDKAAPPATEKKDEPPPPPPQEIVLKVFMHCEGCARKVRRCLKGFPGVEDVITDCKTSKVVVKGEKAAADPVKVLERIQRKSHRQVELISPIPKPPSEEPNKPQPKEDPQDKKPEPVVITVVLGVYMHCEACAQEIKKRIMRMKGVESAEPELKSSQVIVKGVFEAEKLTDYVYKRTGKHAVIIKVEPEKKEEAAEEKGKEGKEEKKPEEGGGGEKEAKKGEEDGGKEKAEGEPEAKAEGGGEPAKAEGEGAAPVEDQKMEVKKNEFYYYHPQNYQVYPQRFVQDMYAYSPQMFSDENPNACTVM